MHGTYGSALAEFLHSGFVSCLAVAATNTVFTTERMPAAGLAGAMVLLSIVLLVRSRVAHVRALSESERRHRIDAALSEQRVTRQQNEALTEEIRERRKVESQLRDMAFHDSLTSLHNRAFLLNSLQEILGQMRGYGAGQTRRPAAPAAVLYLDLDAFKVINDLGGHRIGDLLLIEVARRLKQNLRPGDTLARMSGDEFTLVLPNLPNVESGQRMASRLLSVIEQPMVLSGMTFTVTASIGICEITSSYTEVEDMLRDADTAMYRAKRDGGNRCVLYDAGMHEAALANLQAKQQLKLGVERKEFVLFFQPLVDLRDESLYGMEALIRWNHPTRGLLAPGAFIALAEETGHILDMGQWVMREACQELARFNARCDRDLVMSLNVSSRQLDLPTFFPELQEALHDTGVDPKLIQLEITESIFLKDAERIGQLFRDIRALGVQIAFDDFGTGYSSLSYLERYPIDTLKLDQSFVQRMVKSSINAEIVQMVLHLARATGMKVSAEGVEEREQAQALVQSGCILAQGYLFSKPVPRDSMNALIDADLDRRRRMHARPSIALVGSPALVSSPPASRAS